MVKGISFTIAKNGFGIRDGRDPLGLTGHGLFTLEDLKDPKYVNLIREAMSLFKKQENLPRVRELRQTIFELYKSNAFQEFEDTTKEVTGNPATDKKASLLHALIIILALKTDVSINMNLDINEMVKFLIHTFTKEHIEKIEKKNNDKDIFIET